MMVDAVIHHWVTLAAVEEAVPENFGRVVQMLAALFYPDDGLLTSTRLDRLQAALDILMGLFENVGLHKNSKKQLIWCNNPATLLADTRWWSICVR